MCLHHLPDPQKPGRNRCDRDSEPIHTYQRSSPPSSRRPPPPAPLPPPPPPPPPPNLAMGSKRNGLQKGSKGLQRPSRPLPQKGSKNGSQKPQKGSKNGSQGSAPQG